MKTKLQRWTCKKLITCCVGPLWDWVHDGDVDLRLRCFRTLGEVGEADDKVESVDALITRCRVLIVESLMEYAQGTGSELYKDYWKDEIEEKQKKKGTPPKEYPRVYPYGPLAAKTEDGFKKVPFPFFASTLGCMYTFLAVEKEFWPKVCAEHSYPMTHLWPEGTVRRSLHFIMASKSCLERVFASYEEDGGSYYGPEDDDSKDEDDDEEQCAEDEDDEDEDDLLLSQVNDVF